MRGARPDRKARKDPQVPWDKVLAHAEGLILLSGGCDGPVDPLFASGRAAEGEPLLTAAREQLLATLGASNDATVWASTRLAEYLRAHHRDAEAERMLAAPHQEAPRPPPPPPQG